MIMRRLSSDIFSPSPLPFLHLLPHNLEWTQLLEAMSILEVSKPQLLFAWLYLWLHRIASERPDFFFLYKSKI